jgi:hypothetical protein
LSLEQPWPELSRGVLPLAGGRDPEQAIARLHEIITVASTVIEEMRRQRLEARAPDAAKLERIRASIEGALLTEVPKAPFFRCVEAGRAVREEAAEWREMTFAGIGKAQLIEPPMEPPGSGFEDMIISQSREMAGNLAWYAFCRCPRRQVRVSARAEDEVFWREIAPLVAQVGPTPILVVSRNAEARALRRFLYAPIADRPKLTIKQRPLHDVFGAEFLAGEAWLFSGEFLQAVRYAETDSSGHYAELTFELGEEMKGALRVRVRQELEWSNTPIFELKAPDPLESIVD